MNKTHFEVVEDADVRLTDALVSLDKCQLQNLLHPDAVYTNPNGEVFIGIKNLPVNNPKIYRVHDIKILERHISFFNNVAVVTAIEKREGTFMDIPFRDLYSTTRTWKFNRNWQMIAATSVLI
ncbi:MAG: nuclear transport factor 2 family protein [Flavobacterium sp.]|uniref:nuclear transport factor 2 family protein n=1 Tax=Flavobacterium sp. TaxID=239 RepID=UPI0011FB876B|nr:nuclear transport factor 2 family protein [Flavobacterium sp.]RZJ67407.1 MAG: nuclear transport factor 2 family protein [Flavobacterium sp.]